MAYIPEIQSDATPTTVLSATAFVLAGVPTTALSVVNFKSVDFEVDISNIGSVSDLRVQFQGTVAASPNAAYPHADWFDIQIEEEVSGSAGQYTTADYVIKQAPPTTGKHIFTVPVRGIKMRLVTLAPTGSVSGSSHSVQATRRV